MARSYGVARSWVYALVTRYRLEGEAAFEPRSRRRRTQPDATAAATVDLIIELRRRLAAQGLDAGADTIGWHLQHHHQVIISRATIYRILRRQGLVVAEPKKKPKSSYIGFQAEQPNETWQADFTHHRLADGTDIEILTWHDDHSRYAQSFDYFDDRRTLTAEPGALSRWRLPACFHPDRTSAPLSYHPSPGRWQRDGHSVILSSASRGQEFIVETNDEMEAWIRQILA